MLLTTQVHIVLELISCTGKIDVIACKSAFRTSKITRDVVFTPKVKLLEPLALHDRVIGLILKIYIFMSLNPVLGSTFLERRTSFGVRVDPLVVGRGPSYPACG